MVQIAKLFAILIFASSFASADADEVNAETIYGPDSRREAYELESDPTFAFMRDSSVSLIQREHFVPFGKDRLLIRAPRLQEDKKLCASERFIDQPTAADCSGVLVDEDVVLTAGHCVRNAKDCAKSHFAFGYAFSGPREFQITVPRSDVYACKEILYREEDSKSHPFLGDFALIRLDRIVPDHRPAVLNRQPIYSVGEPLIIAGYPSGLPLKFADGVIRAVHTRKPIFDTTLDSFGGNSGSPVYSRDGKVIGIMVDGDDDYQKAGSCYVAKRCRDNGCLGQGVVEISAVLPHLKTIREF